VERGGSRRICCCFSINFGDTTLGAQVKRRLFHQLIVVVIFAVALVLFGLFLRYFTARIKSPQSSSTATTHITVSFS
jgi:hypothetical protein